MKLTKLLRLILKLKKQRDRARKDAAFWKEQCNVARDQYWREFSDRQHCRDIAEFYFG